MNNSDNQFDRTKFDAVWHRVLTGTSNSGLGTPGCPKPEHDDTVQLRRFMDDEAGDAQLYWVLSTKFTGSTRSSLLRISSDEQHHLKRLRGLYFIMTGETYTPPGSCPLILSARQTLRRKYDGERAGAAAYLSAASMTQRQDLSDTYTALAQDETRHSKMIGCMIENML